MITMQRRRWRKWSLILALFSDFVKKVRWEGLFRLSNTYRICIGLFHVCALAFAAQDALRLGCAASVRGDQLARRALERFTCLPRLGPARSGRRQSGPAQTPARLCRGPVHRIHCPAPNGRRGMPRGYASVGRGRLPGTGLGLWSPQSDGGAGVFGTLPRSEVGDTAAQAGSAEELHFPFEPADQRLAGSAERAGAADCQVV